MIFPPKPRYMNENIRGHRTLHPGEIELVVFDSAQEIDTKKRKKIYLRFMKDTETLNAQTQLTFPK